MRFNAVSVFLVMSVCLIALGTACSGEDAQTLAGLGGQMNSDDKAAL